MLFDELWGKSTPNSWARVPRGPVAAAVGSFFFSGAAWASAAAFGTAVTWGTVAGWLITTAVTTWALSALAPKIPSGGGQRGLQQNVREPTGAFDIVYGTIRKGGVITFMKSTGNDNKFMHYTIVLAGHEVAAIRDIYIGDEKVTLDANGFVTGNRWKSKIRIKKHLGSPAQVADPHLVSEADVGTNFRGRGIAYLYVRLEYDQEVFADGTPTVTAVVDGKKVFDPRSGTTTFSNNAALCIRDYLSSPEGVKSPVSAMSSASWGVAATVCDDNMPLKGGTSEKRYTINGVLSTASSPRNNIQNMLSACGGTLFWGQGAWHIKAGFFPSGPYLSFDENDFRSGIDLMTKQSRKDTFNLVRGTFVDAFQDWIEVDYPEFKSPAFIALDGGQENVMDMQFPMTTSPATAQRLAKMALFRSREEMTFSADFSLKAVEAIVGDVVQINFERYGWVNKFFEVVGWKINPDGGELKVTLILKESSAAAYDWDAEEKDITGNNTILPIPGAGLTISNLTITNFENIQADGTYLGEVGVDWDAASSAFVEEYDIQWRRHTDTLWSATKSPTNSVTLSGIRSGEPYYYRVRAKSIGGFVGPWTQVSTTVVGKTTAPSIPTDIVAKGSYRSVNLEWTNPTQRDFNHVEVYTNSVNDSSTATLVGKSGGTTFIHGPIEPMIVRWYFLRAVNHSGLKSPFSAGVEGIALFVEENDIDVDVKQLLEDAGISGVEVLPNLPTTDNFVGRTIYNSSDSKLYTWDGTQWTSGSDQFDGLLEDINFPTSLRPVETVNTLPTTGNFKGRVVFLTTDNKLYRHTGSPAGAAGFTATTPAGDITGQITETQIGPNSINTGMLQTNAISTDKLDANAVTAAKVAASAITTEKLQAGAVIAAKMAIGDFTNLVPDSGITLIENWTTTGGWTIQPSGSAFTGENWVYADMDNSGVANFHSMFFTVEAGKEYFASVQARANTGNNVILRIAVQWQNQDGSFPPASWLRTDGNGPLSNSRETFSSSFVAPAGAVRARVFWGVVQPSTGRAYVGSPVVRLKAGGELIVDGAITATKMAANAVVAGVISAGAINTAALFVNGVITAAKLNVNQLSAISANLGTITAGSINIGSGRFVVNTAGNVTIRSGTTGERLVITNTQINVYDAAGTLRVRMGQL